MATPATYVVRITKDSFASASLVVTLDGGQATCGLDVSLKPGAGTVHGVVQSGLAGVGALRLTLASTTTTFTSTTRTDEPVGAFELPGVPLGTYSLTLEGDGWQTSAREVVVDQRRRRPRRAHRHASARRRRSAASSASRWSR